MPFLRRKVFQKGDYPKAAFLIVQILINYKKHEEMGTMSQRNKVNLLKLTLKKMRYVNYLKEKMNHHEEAQ